MKERYYSESLLRSLAYDDDVNGNCDGMIDFTVVDSISGAGVVPVVHGEWKTREEYNDYLWVECSNCGFRVENYKAVKTGMSSTDIVGNKWNACPVCCARMDGGKIKEYMCLHSKYGKLNKNKVKPRKIEPAFCLECSKKVKFKIEWKNRLVCRAYSAAEYKELYAICKECGNEVYVPAINDINVNHREKAYAELLKTQIQPTPIVTGEAAKRIEKQLKTRPFKDVEKGIEILKKMFLDGGNSNENN